jgi:hypothetical protein
MPIRHIFACAVDRDVYLFKDGVSTLYKHNKPAVSRKDTLQAGVDTYNFLTKNLRAKNLNVKELFLFLFKKNKKWPSFSLQTVVGIKANTEWLKNS